MGSVEVEQLDDRQTNVSFTSKAQPSPHTYWTRAQRSLWNRPVRISLRAGVRSTGRAGSTLTHGDLRSGPGASVRLIGQRPDPTRDKLTSIPPTSASSSPCSPPVLDPGWAVWLCWVSWPGEAGEEAEGGVGGCLTEVQNSVGGTKYCVWTIGDWSLLD